jgi:hypothetical protein
MDLPDTTPETPYPLNQVFAVLKDKPIAFNNLGAVAADATA